MTAPTEKQPVFVVSSADASPKILLVKQGGFWAFPEFELSDADSLARQIRDTFGIAAHPVQASGIPDSFTTTADQAYVLDPAHPARDARFASLSEAEEIVTGEHVGLIGHVRRLCGRA